MHNKLLRRVLFFWILLISLVALFGDVSIAAGDAGRTAADFLRIGPGARAAGMGGAFTAVSQGALATYWNPAGLKNLEYTEISLSHFAWYQDITLEHGSVAFPMTDRAAVGLSVTYLNYGQIDGYDATGLPTGDLQAYDWAAGLSLGIGVTDDFSLGVTGKYVRQQLDSYDAAAFAFDAGLKYRLEQLTVGAAVTNLGSEMTFISEPEKLPASVQLGLAARPFGGDILGAVEVEKAFYGGLRFRQGVEVGFAERYFVRTGYDYSMNNEGRSFTSGLSIGAGVRLDFAEFDYAYSPQDDATSEDLHRFTLVFRLNQ